jgi:hypothetical protein
MQEREAGGISSLPGGAAVTFRANGIDGCTGGYLLPAQDPAQLVRRAAGRHGSDEHRGMHDLAWTSEKVLAVGFGIDPLRLDSSGWGVIFAAGGSTAVRDALRPLLDARRAQSGRYFREYAGEQGYRPGMSSEQFLVEHGSAPGQPADPECIPYYLLIVGDPATIPFQFQYELGLQYAVGRIVFDSIDGYASYARTVAQAEEGRLRRGTGTAFFGPGSPDDEATLLSSEQLVQPLSRLVAGSKYGVGWTIETCVGPDASRQRLANLVSAGPALLFSASHGVGFPSNHAQQARHQGALLCGDWPGPVEHVGPLPPEFYFSADDAERGDAPGGLIAMLFACFGAGTPEWDDFPEAGHEAPLRLAPAPMVAPLVKAMLGHAGGGALAIVGHVDRAWGWSFSWPGTRTAQLAVFRDALLPLMAGHPVGHAMNVFRLKHGELAAMLVTQLAEIYYGKRISDPDQLAGMWTAYTDARNYLIMGDPAVRLAL